MILSESELSQRAANETLPLRDAFAVLFFVSVGMLVDPMILVRDIGPVLATLLIILFGKSVAAYAIVRLFGHPQSTALTISASLAQIGEFAFILGGLGVALSLLPERGRDLILAGAILSILLNPLLFAALDWWTSRSLPAQTSDAAASESGIREKKARRPRRAPMPVTALMDHVVLVGHGRVGRFISPAVTTAGVPLLVVEDNADDAAKLKERSIETIVGNAADPEIVKAVNLQAARCLLVAIPDAFEGGQVVQQARTINPGLTIIARSHSEEENQHLLKHGASQVIMGEHEIAKAMISAIPRAAPADTPEKPPES
jgi:CPA2 family monovalent cation:H+ antiporter-2